MPGCSDCGWCTWVTGDTARRGSSPQRPVPARAPLGGLGGRRPKEARLLATRLAGEDGPVSGELRALLDDRVSRVENYGSLLLVLVIVALMVFKP